MKKTLALLVILSAIGYFYYQYNRPVKSLGNTKTDVSISANELLSAYLNDETSADSKFLNKIIEVKGTLSKIENEADGTMKLYIAGDTGSVISELEKGADMSNVIEGSQINVKGLCTGFLMEDVVVTKATIIRQN